MKQLVNESRAHFFETIDVDLRNNPKRFWSVFKLKSKSSSVPEIVSMRSGSDAVYIAELFSKYFTSIISAHDNETDFTTPPLNATDEKILSELVISPDDVLAALLNLDTNKATRPDGISPRLLRETAHQIAPSLGQLFNKSLSSGSLPNELKLATSHQCSKKVTNIMSRTIVLFPGFIVSRKSLNVVC